MTLQITPSKEIQDEISDLKEGQVTSVKVEVAIAGVSTEIVCPPLLTEALSTIINEIAAGRGVTIVSQDEEMTAPEAAKMLNISRQTLNDGLDSGEILIPFRLVGGKGSHRRLRSADVIRYKEELYQKRSETLDELAQESQKLGLY